MAFPNAYSFIEGAFNDDGHYQKGLRKGDALVDDVFQNKMDVMKAQKLKQSSAAWLD